MIMKLACSGRPDEAFPDNLKAPILIFVSLCCMFFVGWYSRFFTWKDVALTTDLL